ncbi:MAG TPA: ATP-binding protein [Thermoanaerobaculia bacterium]
MAYRSIGAVLALSVLCMVAVRWLAGDAAIVQVPVHSAVETAGALIALGVGWLALVRFRQVGAGHYVWVSASLATMGVLDLVHAFLPVSNVFFWSRAMPTLIGGLLIAAVWLPHPATTVRGARRFVGAAVLLVLPLCVSFVTWRDLWPLMFAPDGTYVPAAKAVDISGGVGYLIGSAFFLRRYRSSRLSEDLVFANQALLFGLAGVLFATANMWDAIWWLFHLLRLAAYVVVLGFVVEMYRSYEIQLRRKLQADLDAASIRFRLLLEHAPFAVIETGPGRRIDGWSAGAERLFGWSAAEAVGRDARELMPFYAAPDADDTTATGSRVRRVRTKEGRLIETEWHSSALSSDPSLGALSLVVDVTARSEARRSLLAAKREAEEANVAKDEFLAAVSHELRTPITSVLGWSGLLREKPESFEPDLLRQAIEQIHQSAQMEKRLIDDLLDVSRADIGHLNLAQETVEIAPLLERTVASLRAAAQSNGVSIACDVARAGAVRGDPARLEQVFLNLLSNAVKFTPSGGSVAVLASREEGAVVVSIVDSGIGIDPAVLPRVFLRFRQGDPAYARTYGGLGLGLAIVKELVTAHGGSVTAESDGAGKGSTFTVRLPALQSDRADPRLVAATAS